MVRQWLYRVGSSVGPLRTVRDRHRFLINAQSWSSKRLANHQAMLVGDLLRHAAKSVPYYRSYWLERGGPILDPARLDQWPIIDAAMLRKNQAALRSDSAIKGARRSRQGLLVDRDTRRWRAAASMRFLEWMGWRPGDRVARVRGRRFQPQALAGWLTERATNQRSVDPRDLASGTGDRSLAAWGPRFVDGDRDGLVELAEVWRRSPALRAVELRAVRCRTPGIDDDVRDIVREAFSAPLFELYHRPELGDVAQSAQPDGPLLIGGESLLVEEIDARVVLTDLRNRSAPLIRYAPGERIVAAPRRSSGHLQLPTLGVLQDSPH